MGSPVKVVKVCFAYVVKPFTGEVVKVCSRPKVPLFREKGVPWVQIMENKFEYFA